MAVIEIGINHLVNTSERSGIILNALIKEALLSPPPHLLNIQRNMEGKIHYN